MVLSIGVGVLSGRLVGCFLWLGVSCPDFFFQGYFLGAFSVFPLTFLVLRWRAWFSWLGYVSYVALFYPDVKGHVIRDIYRHCMTWHPMLGGDWLLVRWWCNHVKEVLLSLFVCFDSLFYVL